MLTTFHGLGDYPLPCEIFTSDGDEHQASQPKIPVEDVDLAVLTFQSQKKYKWAKWGDSEKVAEGQTVFVSGFPTPSEAIPIHQWTFTPGKIVSNTKQVRGYGLTYTNITKLGMSGGPVLNHRGKVIGIHGQ